MHAIGLVATDEVVLAGGYSDSNSGYYLYTGNTYWTMSPSYYIGRYAGVRYVTSSGYVDYNYDVNISFGVRPTLNLKADSLKSGDGTMASFYQTEL